MTNQDNCYQPLNPQPTIRTTPSIGYTLTDLLPFSAYSISVSARRRGTKYGSTTETVSLTTRQLGMYQFILKLRKVIVWLLIKIGKVIEHRVLQKNMYRRLTPKYIGICVGMRNLRFPTTKHLSYIEKRLVIVTSNMSTKSLMHMTTFHTQCFRPLVHRTV